MTITDTQVQGFTQEFAEAVLALQPDDPALPEAFANGKKQPISTALHRAMKQTNEAYPIDLDELVDMRQGLNLTAKTLVAAGLDSGEYRASLEHTIGWLEVQISKLARHARILQLQNELGDFVEQMPKPPVW